MARAHRRLLLAGLLALALGLRLWRIDLLPPGFHFDESFEGLEAWRILTTPSYRPLFLEGNFGVAPLNAYVGAVALGVAGLLGLEPGPAPLRAAAAVTGALGVLAVYFLADELRRGDRSRRLSPAFPLLAAAALAVMRWHVHFSRMAIEPIHAPLEWALATALLLRGWRTGGWLHFAALGVVLAATLYTYQGAWVIPFVVAASALLLLLLERRPMPEGATAPGWARRRLWGLALAALSALLLVTPLLLYFARNPDLLILRPAQISVVGATGSPADAGIWANTAATLKMFWPFAWPFGPTGDLDPRRNLPGAPALPFWLALPFFAGVAAALRNLRAVAGWLPLLGLGGLLAVGVFSEYAPHFHRILGAAAPTALLCGLGLDAFVRLRPGRVAGLRWAGAAAAAVLLLGALGSGARDYFVRWAALPDLYYAFDEGLWDVGRWIAEQPAATPVYLTPRPADHPTLAFAWETAGRPAPVTFDARAVFPVREGENAQTELYVVIEHEDFRGPLILRDVLPQAQAVHTFHDRSGTLYATVYARAAGTTAERPPQRLRRAEMGDGIALLGYDVQPAALHPGDTLYVQYHWRVQEPPAHDWTVFTHLTAPTDPGAPPVAGQDGPPGGGSLPTTRWEAGWRVLDEHQIALPAALPPGEYVLTMGLYAPDGARLPAGDAAVRLGTVTLTAAE